LFKVEKASQWAVAWNQNTHEAAYLYWDVKREKQYLFTNAFRYQKKGGKMERPPFVNVYTLFFNECD